jgi:multisubunit Na+/H+ antiporter MnhG subunit
MSNQHGEPGHGHSPASWATVIIMLIAIALGTVALFIDSWTLFWVAVGILVLGPIVGWAMSKAGYGVNGSKTVSKAH